MVKDMIPTDQHSHFSCRFSVAPTGPGSEIWPLLAKKIRGWIVGKEGAETNLLRRWFYAGGTWGRSPSPRTGVETARAIGEGTENSPDYWAVSYTHPCGSVAQRQWLTDIGLTRQSDGQYVLSLATSYWLTPGYIGPEPKTPLPTTPSIVSWIVSDDRWSTSIGESTLATMPEELKVGGVKNFVELLRVRDRPPVVYVSRPFPDRPHMIEPGKISRQLMGSAVVYQSAESNVDKEFEWLLPDNYRCWNGMVRVYRPGVKFDSTTDYRRHRFFTSNQIEEIGAAEVSEMVVRGIARLSASARLGVVISVGDVHDRTRRIRIRELADSGEKDEL